MESRLYNGGFVSSSPDNAVTGKVPGGRTVNAFASSINLGIVAKLHLQHRNSELVYFLTVKKNGLEKSSASP